MADGFARVSGKVGVAMATSGPGATNMITGLATAMMDSIPIVCVTGQVPSSVIGTDAFQEIDITGATIPVTKHNYLVMDINELAATIKEAFHVARSGRPGPVLIDIPKDIQNESIDYTYPQDLIELPGEVNSLGASKEQVKSFTQMIKASKRPFILAGHGVIISEATSNLMMMSDKAQIPIGTTLLGIG